MFKKINNIIIPLLDKIFVGKLKKYSLFFTALLDSVIAILPTDLITVYYFMREKKASVFFQALAIALGSVLGGSILYFFGSVLLDFFPSIVNSEYYFKIKDILEYSFWIQFLFVGFFAFSSVIPFTWLSVLLGVFNVSYILVYILAVFIGRFVRFFIVAFLTKKYGEDILNLLNKKTFWFINLFKKIFKEIKSFIIYWYKKRNEVRKLNFRDLKQANIITQIELFTEEKNNIFIKLKDIIFLHPIDRDSAMNKMKKRVEVLRKRKEELLKEDYLGREKLDNIMPSITPVKIIKINKDKVLVWEGNGRMQALKKVFDENLSVEVVEYKVSDMGKKIINNFVKNLIN